MLEQRINDLEIKFSHQDHLVDQLNKIISNQQLMLEKLQKDILELKLSHSENGDQTSRTLADDVPPHF